MFPDFWKPDDATETKNYSTDGIVSAETQLDTIKDMGVPDFSDGGDWTQGTGWSVAGGVGIKAGASSSGTIQPASAITPVIGKNYKMTIDITLNDGFFGWQIDAGGFTEAFPPNGDTGTFTFVFTATTTDNMIMTADSGLSGAVFDLNQIL